jgi:predicted exporter
MDMAGQDAARDAHATRSDVETLSIASTILVVTLLLASGRAQRLALPECNPLS